MEFRIHRLPTSGNALAATLDAAQIERAIAGADESTGILFALLASSGLRIGEAMSLRTKPAENVSFFANGAVTIATTMWRGQEQTSPKTSAARRTIELARPVAERVASFAGKRSGFLFGSGECIPREHQYRRRLDELIPGRGFHAFRRYRITWLRKQRAPEDLIRVWCGHAEKSVTDGYSKLSEDVEYRREVAENVGIGFDIAGCVR